MGTRLGGGNEAGWWERGWEVGTRLGGGNETGGLFLT